MGATRARSRFAVVLGAALLAGCSGGGAAEPTVARTAPSSPEPTTAAEAGLDVARALAEIAEVLGPLERYVGQVRPSLTGEQFVASVNLSSVAAAACMADQGFELTPTLLPLDAYELTPGPVRGTAEFAQAWGYGVWSRPESVGELVSVAVEDPNAERVQAMPADEREAYQKALAGDLVTGEGGRPLYEGGCSTVPVAPTRDDAEHLRAVWDAAFAFLQSLDQDARFGEVDGAWAACMAEAGAAYASPLEAERRFQEEREAATRAGDPAPEVVAERAAEEVRVAVADLACREATDWEARHRAVELELQREYVDAHRADLEALAEALGLVG